MSPTPPLHVHTLTPDRLANHLESDSPFNACVTTLTTTAILMGNLSILDDAVKQLDYSPHFRTGTTRFKNARVVRMRLRSKRGIRSFCYLNPLYVIIVFPVPVSFGLLKHLILPLVIEFIRHLHKLLMSRGPMDGGIVPVAVLDDILHFVEVVYKRLAEVI